MRFSFACLHNGARPLPGAVDWKSAQAFDRRMSAPPARPGPCAGQGRQAKIPCKACRALIIHGRIIQNFLKVICQ